jgi:hypothetical protein
MSEWRFKWCICWHLYVPVHIPRNRGVLCVHCFSAYILHHMTRAVTISQIPVQRDSASYGSHNITLRIAVAYNRTVIAHDISKRTLSILGDKGLLDR